MEKSWEKTLRASFSWNEVTFPFSILSRRNVIKKKKRNTITQVCRVWQTKQFPQAAVKSQFCSTAFASDRTWPFVPVIPRAINYLAFRQKRLQVPEPLPDLLPAGKSWKLRHGRSKVPSAGLNASLAQPFIGVSIYLLSPLFFPLHTGLPFYFHFLPVSFYMCVYVCTCVFVCTRAPVFSSLSFFDTHHFIVDFIPAGCCKESFQRRRKRPWTLCWLCEPLERAVP